MSWQARALVVLMLAGIVAAPVATLHPFAAHLGDGGQPRVPRALSSAAILALFVLAGASIIPLARFIVSAKSSLVSGRLSRNLQRASVEAVEEGIRYRLIALPEVVFVTAGLVRPRIYASTGARAALAPEAFRAALLHERAHQRRFDVAWRFALLSVGHALRPIPAIRRAIDGLVLESEFAADRAALKAGATARGLFDAVVAASQPANIATDGRTVGAGLSGVGTVARLTALAGEGAARPAADAWPLVWVIAALGAIPLAAHTLFWLGAACF